MESTDLGFSHSGLQARSPEGHAAKAMHIRGDEFVWVEIQEKTFTNWVNENLKAIGLTATNLQSDFCDGLKLIALIEVLQKKKLKKIRKPLNQHQYLENVQTALNAMAADNIKLVNIGNTDIVEGNLKLILGLVWSLILRYQIGRTNFPPKKLMLAWLQAILPDLRITNFTSDWNDGIALGALLDYCRPGLFPNWKTLNANNRVENCQNAMTIAKEEFDIPMILTPEHLASPNLDELSGMTYLSYYMKEGGPGYNATLAWIRKQLPHLHIQNFTTDWNDGVALCALVRSLGAQVSAYPNMGRERSHWESNIQQGLNGGKYLGVESLLKAKEIADTEVEHLGVMAYVARFQWTRPRKSPSEKISITGTDLNNVHVNKPAHFRINLLDSSVDLKTIKAEVKGPNGNVECRLNLSKTGGTGIFIPHISGKHELIVYCEGETVSGCPLDITVHPDISRILFSGIDPCALGSIVEVLINSSGTGSGNVLVEAIAPSGKSRECPVNDNDGVYTATFTPNEIGEWKISVTYSSEHIQGSPFTCYVYDPTQVQVRGLDHCSVGKESTFICDASQAGWGEVKIDVHFQGRSIPLQLDERGNGVYRVTFTPTNSGHHKVIISFNGAEIKGSPYSLFVLGEGMSKLDSGLRQSKEDLSIHQRSKILHSSKELLTSDSTSTQKIGGVLRVNHHGSAGSDTSSRHSEDIVLLNSKKNFGSSRDIHSTQNDDSEGLTFRQRAELLHNSLSFHQKETSGTRMPKVPPPTAKKPGIVSPDITTKSWGTRDQGTPSGIEKMTIETKIRTTRESASEDQRRSTSDIVHELKQRDDFSVKSKNDPLMKSTEKLVTSNYSRDGSSNSSKNEHSETRHVTHTSREVKESGSIASKYKKGDIFQVVVGGDGLKLVPVKRPATFTVNARGFDQDDISVTVTAPSGRDIPIRMDTLSPGQYEVEYISPEVGEHLIDVHINKSPLRGSPFHCFAYDASKIHVGKIPNGVVGKPVEFEIEGSEAGSGNLEILVNGGHVTSQVKNLGNHRFLASFIPHAATTHTIEMKFNGEQVPGSPWRCDITEPTRKVSVKGDGLHSFSTGRSTSFEICTAGFRKEDIRVTITGPNKNILQYRLIELHNDTYKVEFKTFEVGTYSVEVLVAGQKVPGSPFLAKSYDASRIQISDIPRMCFVGQTYQFQVDASQAGEGQLEISVNDGAIPNQVQVLSSGKCLVSFRPEVATSHKVDIKFNSENVPGCPLMVDVTEASQTSVSLSALELIPISQTARFTVNGKNCKEDELKVTITSPSQTRLPVKVSNGKAGLAVEFVPKEVGSHPVVVEYGGLQVSGSPYTIKVYDSQKVDVSGSSQGTMGQTVQFTVDASLAGEGNLEITVSSRGRNIPTQVHPLGSAKFGVSFVPTEPSDHVISISFNKEPVPGSPFKVVISETGKIIPSGPSSVSATINKTASFVIQNVSGKEQDLNVQVEGPQGAVVPCSLRDNGNGTVRVDFSPDKTGEHKINVGYQNSPIPGSPFITKVYDIKQIKVRDIPIGVVGKPVTFLVETANAGPGNLEVMVNSGQVPTTPQAQSSTLYAITFVPKELRPHLIDLKFNGETVPGCPYECHVVDPGKIKISGEGLERVPVNRATTFMIDTHGINMGDIKVVIDGPNQKQLKEYIHGNHHSGYRVEYTPTEVGDHTVDVRLQDIHIGGSPFLVKAYDSSRVKVTDVGSGVVGKPVYFSLDASQAGAGNLEIIVSVSGRNVPNYVQSEGNAKFRVNFKPTEAQTHTLSVKFNGEPVPGSPFYVKVSDSNQSVITGSSLRMTSLARGAQFTIDTCGMDKADCKVIVTGPTGKNLPVTLTKTTGTAYQAQFAPADIGPHHVVVLLDGSPIAGSPFTCNVYDVNKVRVSKLSPGSVGKPVTFQVDASQAGEGTLELVVTTRKSSVRAEVSMKSRGLYDVTFIPQEKTSHYVNITFNDEDVAGSPFKIDVKDGDVSSTSSSQNVNGRKSSTSSTLVVKGEGLKQGLVGSTNVFEIDTNGLEGDVDVKITGPMGAPIPNKFYEIERGFYKVEYVSREIGSHKIEVYHRGSPLYSKPFLVEVSDPSRVKLVDVEDGIVGREQIFKVDASRAGRGSLSIFITTGGREVKHIIKELGTGIHQVSYVPRTDLPHKIDVYFNGHQAPGCPQIVEIRDPSHSIIAHGAGLKAASVGARTTFLIETGGVGEAKDFDILVSSPNGAPLPVKCYQQKDRSLLVEWVAQHVGTHRLEVLFVGKPIAGSPFSCQVFDSSKVTLQKIKSTTFSVNERISLALSRRDAGYAELDVTVTSPLGRHLPIEVKGTPDGDGELIEFTPTVPGKYKIAITYGSVEVPGSPITFIAQDGKAPEVSGNGLLHAQVGVPATFKVNASGLYGKPEVRVDGPDTEAETSIEEEEDGLFVVTYKPGEVGVFDVKVLWNSREIPGSPFHPKVVNPSKVRVIGGWESISDSQGRVCLTVGEEKRIPIDVGDAGPGKLKIDVRSPAGMAETHLEQMGSHKYRLCFTPNLEGEHYIYMYFADIPLPKSPFMAYAEEITAAPDHTKVVLRGHGLAAARIAEEAEFIIDGSEAGAGNPEVNLTGVKADVPVQLQLLGNNIYKALYTPLVPGAYLLNVLWSERQVKGCPFKVNVTANCDSGKVVCSGDGLRGGAVGKEIKAFIDTRKAGPGELTAHCMGPHKVAYCELYDHRDGTFTLYLKPQEGGRHVLTVKYGGDHVPGSPFTLRIAGAPDASKVRVYGPGIEPGVLATYQSRFICDTRGAGAGQLTVRIRGPKGAFRVEMQRESQKDRTILCKYDPTEPGDYRLEVKWSGEHVPGSPFMVMIFDTQEELNRYVQNHYNQPLGQGGMVSSDYYGGSMVYSTGFGQMSWRGSTAEL